MSNNEAHTPRHAAPTEHIPHEEFVQEGRLKIVFTGIDSEDIRDHAAEAANAQLDEKLGTGNKFNRMLKSMWHGNAMRLHYLNKYARKNEEAIIESQDIQLLLDEGVKEADLALEETKRWAQAFNEDLRDDLLGEKEAESFSLILDRNPDGSENREGAHLKEVSFQLIEDYAAGRLNDDSFNEEKKRVFAAAAESGTHANLLGRGQLYLDNLLQIAQNAKAMVDHDQSLGRTTTIKDVLQEADIITGEAKVGPETKRHQNAVERVVGKLNKVPILRSIDERHIVAATSIVLSLSGWAAKTTAGAISTALLLPGAAGGIAAGLAENRRVKEERAQHGRAVERGQIKPETDDLGKRRESLEEGRYESKSAEDLIGQISVLYDDNGEFRVKDGSPEQFKEAIQIIAECEARLLLSRQREIGLIDYSAGSMQRERRILRTALAKAKCDMRHVLGEASPDDLTGYGVNPEDIDHYKSEDKDVLNLVLDPIREGNMGVLDVNVIGEINQDQRDKDRVFNKLRLKRVAGAVVLGTVLGTALGVGLQEAVSVINPNTQGLVEQALNFNTGAEHHTVLESLRENLMSPQPVEMSSAVHAIEIPGTKNTITLPDNLQIEQTGDHQISINGKDIDISDLKVNPDGSLSQEAQDALAQAGFNVGHNVEFTTPLEVHHNVNSDPNAILGNHADQTTRVSRDLWYANDTPMRGNEGADFNELGLQNPVRDAAGNIHIKINGMTEGGSWQGSERANWQELARQGKLEVALSLSKGTQHEVFMAQIGPNGEAIFASNSPEAGFFSPGTGEVQFNGQYTEVVEVRGVDANGTTHIAPLATDIGAGRTSLPDIITTKEPQSITNYSLQYTPEKVPDVSIPPVLPWYPRSGLRVIHPATIETNPNTYYLGGYFDVDPVERQRYLDRMSPRLSGGDNPDVELDEREETEWYWNSQTPEHRTRVSDLTAQTQPMSSSAQIVVAIPVAGHQEQDNIYHTLSAYLNQSLDKDSFEIVLYVNHPETNAQGAPTSAQATLDEITRFQNDHPDMPVRVMYEKLPRSEAKIGLIRKMLNDAIVKRSLDRSGTPGSDVIIVSNDADTISMSDIYLENFVNKFNDNPNVDAMLGQLDWDNDAYLRYPAMHVATRLFLYDEIMKRRASNWIASSGANFSMLMKNFAAVGGYNTDYDICEDVELGRALKTARSGAQTKEAVSFAGNKASRLETSARRAAYVYETFDDAPYNQWNYSFSADDDAVRGFTVSGELPDLSDSATRAGIVESTQTIINKTLRNMFHEQSSSVVSEGSAQQYVERCLTFCGLGFTWNSDRQSITITDTTNMFEGLEAFKARHLAKGRGPIPT